MLVLTRKYQEKIRIGDNITITVLRMKGKAVRLGIEAPAEVPVVRGELSFANERQAPEGAGPATLELGTSDTADATARNGRNFCRAVGMHAQWESKSRPDAAAMTITPEPGASVGFGRVPRDKVANLLPKFVAGPAPLRAMMDQGRS
jgi:carbon storage regulator